MYKMRDNDIPWKNALQIIEDITRKYNIPVVYNFPRDTSATTELVMGYSSS
jgi:hypothetical protein